MGGVGTESAHIIAFGIFSTLDMLLCLKLLRLWPSYAELSPGIELFLWGCIIFSSLHQITSCYIWHGWTHEQLCKKGMFEQRLVEQPASWKADSQSIPIAKCTKQAYPYVELTVSGVNRHRKAAYTAESCQCKPLSCKLWSIRRMQRWKCRVLGEKSEANRRRLSFASKQWTPFNRRSQKGENGLLN